MKFPQSARLLRSQLDATPFATVFFLLAIFILLGSRISTPGVRIQLPMADNLPGTERHSISVAVDGSGRFYYENQLISETALKSRMEDAAKKSPEPLTLVIHADQLVANEKIIRLALLAREAGIREALLATLPRTIASP